MSIVLFRTAFVIRSYYSCTHRLFAHVRRVLLYRQHTTRHVGGPILRRVGLAFWRTQSDSTLSFHSPLRNIMTSVMTKLRYIIPHASRDQISFLTRQRPNLTYTHLLVCKTFMCVCV